MAGKKRTYSPYVQSCLDKCKSEFTVSKSNKRKSVKKSPIFSIDDVGGIEDLHKKIREFKDFLISKGLSEDEIIEHLNLIDKDMKTKKYGLVWEDREEDVYEQAKKKFALLTEVEDREIKTDDSKPTNLLIEGDNLESLLSLQYTHKGLVNVIYIDPPYNTGNKDFRYNDRYVDKEDTWRHSSWLSFMHKRLLLAKDLLADDGVIFISIDDNEMAQLRLLCDEIFGENNRIDRGMLIWNNAGSSKGFRYIVKNHEYILAYSKNSSKVKNFIGFNKPEILDEVTDRVYIKRSKKNPIKRVTFEKGTRIEGITDVTFTNRVGGDTTYLDIVEGELSFKDGVLVSDVVLEGSFSIPSQINSYYKNKKENKKTYDDKGQEFIEIYFNKNGLPQYRKKRNTIALNSVIKDVSNSGKRDLDSILDSSWFAYPKPIDLVKLLLLFFSSKDATILDFFAGSGTTGNAVMELNKEDGGNRQFILCTNNENNICEEVTYQRLNKVINGYTTPKGKVVEGLGGNLKYYKTAMMDKGETYNENKSRLVSNMNSLISIKENAFNLEVEEDSHVVYSSKDKYVFIYNDTHTDSDIINNCIDSLNKNRGNKELVVYLPLDDSSAIDNVVLPTYQDLGIRFELIPKDYINQYKRLVDNRG